MSDTPNSTPTGTPAAGKAPRPAARPKVPPFARYRGTSAWRKDRRRVKAYALFLAKQKAAGAEPATPAT